MKRLNKTNVASVLGMLALVVTLSTSCNKPVVEYAAPQLTIEGSTTVDLAPGKTTDILLKLNGAGGAKSVVVKKNGGFLKEITVTADATELKYTTDALAASAAEGEETTYSFSLTNLSNRESEPAAVVIKAARYAPVTIGNTELYSLQTAGSEGVVAAGDEIKLAKGRKYYLPASLSFAEGSKLTIEQGVRLYMNADAATKVLIEVAGEVNIAGAAAAPVVMTSSKLLTDSAAAAPNDWDKFQLVGKGGTSGSGTISYLRVEYGGARAFRLSNVGSATQIDHVQAFKSSGEGIMVTDGSVNLKYLVATDCQGGSFRLGDAYAGKIQFALSVSTAHFAENDDFTIRERATPTIANVTILGPGKEVGQNTHGMRMRANAAPKVYNAIVAGFPRRGLRAQDDVTITDLSGSSVFAYSYVFDVKTDPYRDLATAFAGTFDAEGKRTANPFFNNATAKSGSEFVLETIAGIGVNDFIPDAEKTSAFNPQTLGAFFTDAPFVGAVKNSSEDWTKGWIKNPNGQIR